MDLFLVGSCHIGVEGKQLFLGIEVTDIHLVCHSAGQCLGDPAPHDQLVAIAAHDLIVIVLELLAIPAAVEAGPEPLADFLGYYLRQMLDSVHVVTTSGTSAVFEQIIGVDEQDAVIAFSFPRYSTSTAQGAQYCRGKGAKVIGITDSISSPLGRNCEHVLLAKSDMISLVDSLTAPMSIVNALIVAIAARCEHSLEKKFEELEKVWEKYNVYEKQVEL